MSETVFLQTAEVSRMLGVTPSRVRQLECEGTLRAMRTSAGARLFRRADVEAEVKRRNNRIEDAYTTRWCPGLATDDNHE
jgi:DNA-binding transcriptional MerR regulator